MEKTTVLESNIPRAATSGRGDRAQGASPASASTSDSEGVPCVGSAAVGCTVSKVSPVRRIYSRIVGGVSTWGFIDQAIVSVASFLAAVCVGRSCSPVELGIYTLAVKVFWLVAGIPNALVWMPYTARAPRMGAERQRFYLGSVTVHLVVVAAIVSLGLLLVGFLPIPGLASKEWLLPMCVALVPFSALMMLREHLRRILLAHMKTPDLLRVDVPIAVLQLAILGVLVWTENLTAATALGGMALGCCWGVFWIYQHRHRFRVERRRVEMHWAHNFRFGRWLVISTVAWSFGEASFYWFIESFHGLTVMGRFSAASITVMLFNPLMLTIQNLARSILSNGYAQGGREMLWQKTVQGTRMIAAGFGVLFFVLGLYGGTLVHLFFGEDYSGLDRIVASLCLGMFFQVTSSPIEGAIATLQDGRSMLASALIRLGVILAAGIPLIHWYGPVGVGFAMAMGSLSVGAYQWFVFSTRYRDAS